MLPLNLFIINECIYELASGGEHESNLPLQVLLLFVIYHHRHILTSTRQTYD
jgi:hypothetical protein